MVSIIVPIYNAEKTLERCLRSIQLQSYQDIEVILVNDGSADHSIDIINKYLERDRRFQLIDKENTGVSDSRNQGIRMATGKYLQFVDSDDWIPVNAVKNMLEAIEKGQADMAIGDFKRVINHHIKVKGHIPKRGTISRAEYATYMMQAPANFYYGVMWNKLYKREIISAEYLECSDELDWCEDLRFNLEYLQFVKEVVVIHEPVYYYVKTKGSLVDTKVSLESTVKMKRSLFQYYKDLYDTLDLYEENKLRIHAFYIEFARDSGRKRKKRA